MHASRKGGQEARATNLCTSADPLQRHKCYPGQSKSACCQLSLFASYLLPQLYAKNRSQPSTTGDGGKEPLLIWAPTPAMCEERWICPVVNFPPHWGSMYRSSKNGYYTFTAQDCACFDCKICLLHGLLRPDTTSLYRGAEVAKIGLRTPQWCFLGEAHADAGRDCAKNKAQTMYPLV